MYVRFIEITSPSTVQFDMAVSWVKTDRSVLALKSGATSFEVVKLSDNSGVVVIHWPDEKTAKNFLADSSKQLREMAAQNKTRILEGPLLFSSKADES